jgi:hypothetical protein
VAIISTPAFNALTVDPETVTLDSAAVKLVGRGHRPLCAAEDVNRDGRADLVCHIVTRQLPAQGDGVAILTAIAFPLGPGTSAQTVRGADFIKVVGDGEDDDERGLKGDDCRRHGSRGHHCR